MRVRLTIAPDGSVSEATVIAAEPAGWFENVALDAVKQWRYQPPGRPLVTEAVIEFKRQVYRSALNELSGALFRGRVTTRPDSYRDEPQGQGDAQGGSLAR